MYLHEEASCMGEMRYVKREGLLFAQQKWACRKGIDEWFEWRDVVIVEEALGENGK